MGLLTFVTAGLALGVHVLATPVPVPQAGGAPSAKVCDAATTVCYAEYVSPERIQYRFAIPENATAGNFDVLLQIVAPRTVGWAGLAWGGVMTNNPLLVAWPNGASAAVATSRRATARTYPTAYADATYTVLPGSGANTTHWTLNALAKGVSSWGATRLNPSGTASFAYAQSASGPSTPADPNSRFSIHNSRGKFTQDLNAAKVANFAALVEKASAARTP